MALYNIDYVEKNKYSRPGIPLLDVRGIVIHWTANPGATDTGHQDYFDGDDGGGERYASAHMFVDKDSATLIVPVNEVAYHANERACKIDKLKGESKGYKGNANVTTLGLELCIEKDGSIHPDTLARAEKIVAEWVEKYKLNPVNDVYRHYDVTGKNCPRPWVEDFALYKKFRNNVKKLLPKVSSTPVYPGELIKRWSDDGKSIKLIQKKLGIDVDGIFGNGTYMAVRNFQARNNLAVDGIVGKNTWKVLFG